MSPKGRPPAGDGGTPATPGRDDPGRSTTPQRDEASTTVPAEGTTRDEPYRNLKMPHERDESATRETPATQDADGTRAVTRQAADDVKAGQQDTDRYNATLPDYKARERKGP